MPINNNTYNPTTYNSTSTPKNYKRGNPIPLDNTALWNSLDDAKAYAKDNTTAYVGQIISVVENNKEAAYIITDTLQEDGSYLRPIADLSKIEQDIADLKELPEHKEVKMANEVGSTEDTSYSIKIDSSDNLCLIKNNTNGTTNSLVIGSGTVKAQHSKTVEEDPIIFPVGQLNTLPINDTDKFKNIEELDADMLPEENRGTKVQQLFKEKQLTTGGIFYDCPTFKQNDSKFGIKFVIDDAGNGHVDLDYSVNSMFDVTYDPETMKIIRFGDFYFYVVYDATNKPIGALCIGRPEGVFAYGNANYSASWRYFSTNTQKQSVPFYTSTTAYTDGTPSGTFDIDNANLDNKYGVDEYGRQWIPRINDLEKNATYAMSPLPVVQFAKQQTNNGPAANNGAGVKLTALTNDNQFAPVYGWGSPTVIYQLFSYDRTVEINETETKTETRYYIILASNNGKVTTTPITNYQFTLGSATYEISKDCTKIILSGQNLIASNILESFDLLKIFNGKGPLLSAKDEYALPSDSKNLWGSYWLTGPDRDKYDIRVGVFDPDETSYEYQVDAKGTKSAVSLNPAGNYSIGKLESFHPLRINMTGDPKVDELYIRTATIKGFKTSMDWPNASAVAPRDCSLRSGTVWVQFIWAYPVKEDKPRLFFRVLFDGYVNTAEYKDLTGTYRYPWSQCYELTNIGAIEEAKKYTDDAITQAISELEIPEMPEVIYTEVQQAGADTLGGIKIGYEQNDKNYPVKLDDTGKAFVEVPWTDTNTTDLTGDGSALTNLNANNIATGIIDEERLPKKYMTEFRINFDGVTTVSMDDSSSQVTAYIFIKTFSNTKYTTGSTGTFELSDFGSFCAKACSISGHLSWTHDNSQRIALIPHNILVSNGNICYYGTKILSDTISNTEEYITPSTINYTVVSSIEI